MGAMISRWSWCDDPNQQNEISGMSLKDIDNVQRSWAKIYANASGNGLLIFLRLFEADPETRSMFKYIAHIKTEAELAANVDFRAHIIDIMASLDKTIQHLDQPELVVVWMEKLGDSHRGHLVERRHFWVLKDVLVCILQNDLKLADKVIESWGRFLAFIYEPVLPRLAA